MRTRAAVVVLATLAVATIFQPGAMITAWGEPGRAAAGAMSSTRPASLFGPSGRTTKALPRLVYSEGTATSLDQNDCSSFLSTATPRGQNGSGGCFVHVDDIFILTDARKDGRSVALYWTVKGEARGLCRDKSGYDDDGDFVKCDEELPENRRLLIKAGLCDETATRSCERPADYTHWGQWLRVYTSRDGAW